MIFEQVKSFLVDQLDVNEADVTLDSLIVEDLGADSLDVVEMLMALEDEFGIKIEDEDAQNFKTIRDIVTYIEDKQ